MLETTKTRGLHSTFFGKVMGFFALAVLASLAGTYVSYTYFMEVFMSNPWLMYVLFAVQLIIILTSRSWSAKSPINRLMFAVLTFSTGVTLAPLIAVVVAMPQGVAMLNKALLATGAMFTATALIGWTTKRDLSGMRGFLMMGLIGLIVVSLIGIFIPWGSTFELVVAGGGVLLFSAFTMYDFQKLKSYPEDRYIDAALMLYLDIFNLFIYILRFIMSFTNRE